MALTVEDGTRLAAADSYISVEDANAYLTSIYGASEAFAASADDATKDATLRRAAQALDARYGRRWRGVRASRSQGLDWPRAGSVDGLNDDSEGYVEDGNGFLWGSDEVPPALGRAQAELARRIHAGTDVLPDIERVAKREKVDVIEVEYADGALDETQFQQVDFMLRFLVTSGGNVGRLVRA